MAYHLFSIFFLHKLHSILYFEQIFKSAFYLFNDTLITVLSFTFHYFFFPF